MGKTGLLAAASMVCIVFAAPQALAAGFVTVPLPDGAIGGGVIGINDQGDVAGSYSPDGTNEIGFAGPIDGTYETFSVDGHPTQARSINNQGRVVGFYAPPGSLNEFERTSDGTITPITKDGAVLIGIPQGLSASGEFVGDYFGDPAATPVRGAYKGKDAAWVADVTLPFAAIRVAARGVNAKGDVAGWFVADAGGAVQGFVIKNGETTVLNYPGSVATFIQGINNKGEMSGTWEDAQGNSHGFSLAADLETWTSFDAPVGTQTQAFQINNLGQIAVNGYDPANGEDGLFIYCPKKAGVCGGKQAAATTSKAKGKSDQHQPEAGGKGPDPDKPKKNGHRQ